MKTSWNEITFNEFNQIIQIASADIPQSYKTVNLVSLLSGMSVDELENLPLSQFTSMSAKLSFLDNIPDKVIDHKDRYKVNGREYYLQADIPSIITAQYIDYHNYSQEEDKDLTKLVSCFLVPVGHKYGDGYDNEVVIRDVGDLPYMDVQAIAFFLRRQYGLFTHILIDYLKTEAKKMKSKEAKKTIKQLTHLDNMVFSHTFSKSWK